tara:strand:- start:279 stop:809 length:531 start_codon:yes stop_codon:yes gene_type:complete
MPTTNKNKNKKSLTNAQKRSAKAHIISVYGSPKVRKKKESVKTRAKISASMRKKCTTKKWGSSNIWPECINVVHNFKKSIPPLKGNVCKEGYKLRKAYVTKTGKKVPARCIIAKQSLNNKRRRSAKAHIISVYGSPKVVKKSEKLKTRVKISKTRRLKGLNKNKWGNSKIWGNRKL